VLAHPSACTAQPTISLAGGEQTLLTLVKAL